MRPRVLGRERSPGRVLLPELLLALGRAAALVGPMLVQLCVLRQGLRGGRSERARPRRRLVPPERRGDAHHDPMRGRRRRHRAEETLRVLEQELVPVNRLLASEPR